MIDDAQLGQGELYVMFRSLNIPSTASRCQRSGHLVTWEDVAALSM